MTKKWGLDMVEIGKLYLVLGCGDVGFAVASRLKCRDVEVAVIERDASKVEALRWRGYAAFLERLGSDAVSLGSIEPYTSRTKGLCT